MKDPNIKLCAKEGYHAFPGGMGSFEITWLDSRDGGPDDSYEPGWYWWACFPSCLPDGEANGPFMSSWAAYKDARS